MSHLVPVTVNLAPAWGHAALDAGSADGAQRLLALLSAAAIPEDERGFLYKRQVLAVLCSQLTHRSGLVYSVAPLQCGVLGQELSTAAKSSRRLSASAAEAGRLGPVVEGLAKQGLITLSYQNDTGGPLYARANVRALLKLLPRLSGAAAPPPPPAMPALPDGAAGLAGDLAVLGLSPPVLAEQQEQPGDGIVFTKPWPDNSSTGTAQFNLSRILLNALLPGDSEDMELQRFACKALLRQGLRSVGDGRFCQPRLEVQHASEALMGDLRTNRPELLSDFAAYGNSLVQLAKSGACRPLVSLERVGQQLLVDRIAAAHRDSSGSTSTPAALPAASGPAGALAPPPIPIPIPASVAPAAAAQGSRSSSRSSTATPSGAPPASVGQAMRQCGAPSRSPCPPRRRQQRQWVAAASQHPGRQRQHPDWQRRAPAAPACAL